MKPLLKIRFVWLLLGAAGAAALCIPRPVLAAERTPAEKIASLQKQVAELQAQVKRLQAAQESRVQTRYFRELLGPGKPLGSGSIQMVPLNPPQTAPPPRVYWNIPPSRMILINMILISQTPSRHTPALPSRD